MAAGIGRKYKKVPYSLSVIKGQAIRKPHWKSLKITFQKQRLWNEVLKIEKMQMHSLDAHLNLSLPERMEQTGTD